LGATGIEPSACRALGEVAATAVLVEKVYEGIGSERIQKSVAKEE
jgi:hypothetical protein